jgi:hypothetical protein
VLNPDGGIDGGIFDFGLDDEPEEKEVKEPEVEV